MTDVLMKTPETTAKEKTQFQCMEVWGGFETADKSFTATGLEIELRSRPCHGSKNGGDVYYISSCASGRISRILLADVSGHGDEVAQTSSILRNLVRKNINLISAKRLTRQLNRDFNSEESARGFATALIATYYCPSHTLTMNIAGHPSPLVYRSKVSKWEPLIPLEESHPQMTDLPLGVFDETNYQTTFVKLEEDDLVLCYTDGLIEMQKEDTSLLGIDGLLNVLNGFSLPETGRIDAIIDRVTSVTTSPLDADDLTVILMKAIPAKITFGTNLMAPFRVLKSLLHRGDD